MAAAPPLSNDPYVPWPVDRAGRWLPSAPVRGLRFDVAWSDTSRMFTRYHIVSSSKLRFVAHGGGKKETWPVSDWGEWLDARVAEGPVTAHLPGCRIGWCRGCDASGVGRPGPVVLSNPASSLGVPMPAVDVGARDSRVLRAAKEVLSRYTFHPVDGPSPLCCVEVRGGTRPYRVTVDPTWGVGPECTCPDHSRSVSGGFCKHIIGVLLRDDALCCQLLELFL